MPESQKPMVFFDRTHRRRGIFRVSLVFGTVALLGLAIAGLSAIGMGRGDALHAVERTDSELAYYYYHLPIHDKKLALTFDDGPDDLDTPRILDTLKEYTVPATFFLIGNHVAHYPDVVQRIVSDGHSIGNHTYTHRRSVHDSEETLSLELRLTDIAIREAVDVSPIFYRPPFLLTIGSDATVNPHIENGAPLDWAIKEGYLPVGADIDPKDWLGMDVPELTQTFREELPKGKIILLHDHRAAGEKHTADALPDMIKIAREAGYTFVPLEELLIPPSHIALTGTLARGASDATSGGQVSLLQWFLFAEGAMSPYDMSGVFDEATEDALVRWQGARSIASAAPTGVVDSATLAAMASVELPTIHSGVAEPLSLGEVVTAITLKIPSFALLIAQIALIAVVLRLILFVYLHRRGRKAPKRAWPAWQGGVSLVIPAYNEGANIRATIMSAARSRYDGPLELIIVDDGSTDNTARIVSATIAQHPDKDITFLQKENGGKASALSEGFRAAKYPIVVAIDGDSILAPTAVTQLAAHFHDPRMGAVAGKVYTAGRADLIDVLQRIEYMVGQNIEKHALAQIGAVSIVPGAIGAWRKSAVDAAGGFVADTLVEDQDMTTALLVRGWHVQYEPRAVAYTETPHSIRDFVKQRFRWVYGTAQCLWKYKTQFVYSVDRPLGTIILPASLCYNFVLPLFYPIIDVTLIIILLGGGVGSGFIAIFLFTLADIAYAFWGLRKENGRTPLAYFVPLQRFLYRPLIWYVVVKSIVRAIEGTMSRIHQSVWNQVSRSGDAERMYSRAVGAERVAVVQAE